jgi:hypothetical protein
MAFSATRISSRWVIFVSPHTYKSLAKAVRDKIASLLTKSYDQVLQASDTNSTMASKSQCFADVMCDTSYLDYFDMDRYEADQQMRLAAVSLLIIYWFSRLKQGRHRIMELQAVPSRWSGRISTSFRPPLLCPGMAIQDMTDRRLRRIFLVSSMTMTTTLSSPNSTGKDRSTPLLSWMHSRTRSPAWTCFRILSKNPSLPRPDPVPRQPILVRRYMMQWPLRPGLSLRPSLRMSPCRGPLQSIRLPSPPLRPFASRMISTPSCSRIPQVRSLWRARTTTQTRAQTLPPEPSI